eukprot:6022027-Alexandrium_andersonii.AAC.1
MECRPLINCSRRCAVRICSWFNLWTCAILAQSRAPMQPQLVLGSARKFSAMALCLGTARRHAPNRLCP